MAPPARFRKAVLEMLKQEGRPLHYTEVGRRLKESGLWAHVREPEKTAKIQLSALARWHRSPIMALGKGFYALREEGGTSPEP